MSDNQHFKETSYLTDFVMEQKKHFKVQYKNNLQGTVSQIVYWLGPEADLTLSSSVGINYV